MPKQFVMAHAPILLRPGRRRPERRHRRPPRPPPRRDTVRARPHLLVFPIGPVSLWRRRL